MMEVPVSTKNYTFTEFTAEFSTSFLKKSKLNKKFRLQDDNNNFTWTVKKKIQDTNSLILDSCDHPEQISKVHVLLFHYDKDEECWRKEPYEMKILYPHDFQKLPSEIMEFGEYKKKIEFLIYAKPDHVRSSVDSMNKYYANLIKNKELSDVTLILENEKFFCHKLILTTRSEVFAAMFNSEMVEKQQGEIKIIDIRPEIFKLVLEFIYSGQISNYKNEEISWYELMLAADKYNIKSLRDICAQKLAENLNPDNAIDTLIIAHRLNNDDLKKESASFIILNKSDIVGTEKLKKLTELNIGLILELFKEFLSDDYCIKKRMKFKQSFSL